MLYRPLYVMTMASVALVLLACLVMIGTGARGIDRFESAVRELTLLSRFELAVRESISLKSASQRGLSLQENLVALETARSNAATRLSDKLVQGFKKESQPTISTQARRVDLLSNLKAQAKLEWWLTVTLGTLLPVGVVAVWWQLRRRVLLPLNTLNGLLATMVRRRYEIAATDDVHPALQPLFESYNDLVTGVVNSQSEQQKRELALRKELGEATRTLMQQHLALTRSDRMAATGELAAQVAHDLRNPLAGILAAVQNLQRDSEDKDHRERLGMVSDEITQLTRQLNELVNAARQPPEPTRDIALRACMESLLNLASYQLSGAIVLEADVPEGLHARVPEGGLRQALLNLVINAGNAIDAAQGHIRIAARKQDDAIVITVCDNGPGFSEQALASGVRSFASYRIGGTGLGLAAVRRFAVDLGGDMSIDNLQDGGARVTLRLPGKPPHG